LLYTQLQTMKNPSCGILTDAIGTTESRI